MELSANNKIVHGLWVGKTLSALELLTIASFIQNGHTFHLWVYEKPETKLPEGLALRDANKIIPVNNLYKRKKNDPKLGFGKDSISTPFSDLFRYKLLYEEGGWWVDMDVTCLKPFSITEPYFFNPHPILPMMGNIMKCPKGSAVLLETYKRVKVECNADTEDWLLPNKILNDMVHKFDLSQYIGKDSGNADWWPEIEGFIYGFKKPPFKWYYFHWVNEMWRNYDLDKNKVCTGSAISYLMDKYNVKVVKQLLPPGRKKWLRETYEPDWNKHWVDFKIMVVQFLRKVGLRNDG